MNKILLFAFICTLLPLAGSAQAVKYKVKGQAIDSATQKSIPFVTVTVKNGKDAIVKQLATDEKGVFSFSLSDVLNGKLILSAVGYTVTTKSLKLAGSNANVDLGKIPMPVLSTSLSQVVVQAQKPLVKIDADKITYSMDADPDTQTSTALDILRKVPLVTVDGEDNISLKGASNFKILVNGKESSLLSNNARDVLKSMPASSIKNIEVITTPSSKYSAEGVGGIINIVSNKRTLEGLTGSVNLRVNNLGGFGGNLYSAGKFGKFTYSVNYGYNRHKSPKSSSEYRMENYKSTAIKSTNSFGDGDSEGNFNFANAEFSYEIDTLNLLSASLSGITGTFTNNSLTKSTSFDADGKLVQQYDNLNNSKNGWGSISGSFDYQRSFKKPDKLLTISYKLEYNPNNSSYNRDIDGILAFPSSRTKSDNNANSNENTFQLDFTNPITKVHSYEVGTKYIIRRNPSDVSYWNYDSAADSWVVDQPRNSSLYYRQDIVAAYAGYMAKIKKVSLKLGARLEGAYTHSTYRQGTETKFSSNLTDVVPYINLSYNITESSSFKASYTQRLQRPGIWYLNPYINDVDPSSISYGNPDLKTERVHNIEMGFGRYSRGFNVDLNLFTRLNDNAIQSKYWVRNDGVRVSTYDNMGRSSSYGSYFYTSVNPVQSFNIGFSGQVSYDEFTGVSKENEKINNSGWRYNFNGNVRWSFLSSFAVMAYGGYGSGGVSLFGKSSSYNYNGISIRKSFLDKKFDLSLQVNNPFQYKQTWGNTTRTTDFYSYSKNQNVNRSFSIAIGYRFGKMNVAVKKANKTISNDDIKAGGSGSGGSSESK